MSNYTVPEAIPFTNDDEAARKSVANDSPKIRATAEDECFEFEVIREEAVVVEKGLYPGSYAVTLTCAPVDEADTPVTNLTARVDLVLPIPNPDVEGHKEPDTGYTLTAYMTAADKTFTPEPKWDKEAKCWRDANGEAINKKTAEEAKATARSKAIKTVREAWNGIRAGNGGGFLGQRFFARVKAGGNEGQYRNIKGISASEPAGTTVVREGFKTTA